MLVEFCTEKFIIVDLLLVFVVHILLAIFLSISLAAAENDVDFHKKSGSSLSAKVDGVVEQLKGRPYIAFPLGEGQFGKFDKRPIYRWDGFDCQTFVEAVLAAVFADNYAGMLNNVMKLRYFGSHRVDYLLRAHFPSLDWFPNARALGFLASVDNQPGSVSVVQNINKGGWLRSVKTNRLYLPKLSLAEKKIRLAILNSFADNYSSNAIKLNYIPTSSFIKGGVINRGLLANLPDAAVVGHVRLNWLPVVGFGTRMHMSHMGLIYKFNKQWFYAEASSVQKKVVKIKLIDFLIKLEKKPSIAGLHLERVLL